MIKNKMIADYVMFKLDKLENDFTSEELDKIEELVINYDSKVDDNSIDIDELKLFKNLKSLTIRHGYILNSYYSVFTKLENLEELVLEDCEFENADLISSLKLKKLSLINCRINNYTFVNVIEPLERLSITNAIIDMSMINKLKNLKYLEISYSKADITKKVNIDSLEELYIDNTNIKNLDFANNLNNLKVLSIDADQYTKNQNVIKKLRDRDITILNESIVEFGGENYGI